MVCIYIGATRSLQKYQFQEKKSDQATLSNENQLLSLKNALSIPIIATLTLVLAYFAIVQKWSIINNLIVAYFSLIGALILKKYIYEYFKTSTGLQAYDYHLEFLQRMQLFRLNMTLLELVCLAVAIYFQYLYLQSRFFVANNIIAMCFAVHAIENWLVGNFRNILIVFLGLIAYDTYFVFHSDVMMTVAQGIELPLKLLVPADQAMKSFAMIGLGDIIIPGLFASMCIRCDLINAFNRGREKAVEEGVKEKEKLLPFIDKEMGCFYFNASLIGFFIGLAMTYSAMQLLKTAQPALLYILPAQLGIYLLASFGRKEFLKMIAYDEDKELMGNE
ncbi:signal peptide peptidase [Stylonychia lemnae]|uniref:Signal peptide peptidase n=1 Tax=Stylonychia lemnae TaxID=5949 RepID=A0A078AA72_STYLE|nr:signal peptide peptidase [Stylonychia lemnae]|eukprot:CDW78781.1 signal peptide peptidase [Stylonychia lemnae]